MNKSSTNFPKDSNFLKTIHSIHCNRSGIYLKLHLPNEDVTVLTAGIYLKIGKKTKDEQHACTEYRVNITL